MAGYGSRCHMASPMFGQEVSSLAVASYCTNSVIGTNCHAADYGVNSSRIDARVSNKSIDSSEWSVNSKLPTDAVTYSETTSRWRAVLPLAGMTHHLGYFDTSAEAASACRMALASRIAPNSIMDIRSVGFGGALTGNNNSQSRDISHTAPPMAMSHGRAMGPRSVSLHHSSLSTGVYVPSTPDYTTMHQRRSYLHQQPPPAPPPPLEQSDLLKQEESSSPMNVSPIVTSPTNIGSVNATPLHIDPPVILERPDESLSLSLFKSSSCSDKVEEREPMAVSSAVDTDASEKVFTTEVIPICIDVKTSGTIDNVPIIPSHITNKVVPKKRKRTLKSVPIKSDRFCGVTWHEAAQSWRATAVVGNTSRLLRGFFDTEEKASTARLAAMAVCNQFFNKLVSEKDNADVLDSSTYTEPIPSIKYCGVSYCSVRKGFLAEINECTDQSTDMQQLRMLGLFNSEDAAADARSDFKRKLKGEVGKLAETATFTNIKGVVDNYTGKLTSNPKRKRIEVDRNQPRVELPCGVTFQKKKGLYRVALMVRTGEERPSMRIVGYYSSKEEAISKRIIAAELLNHLKEEGKEPTEDCFNDL